MLPLQCSTGALQGALPRRGARTPQPTRAAVPAGSPRHPPLSRGAARRHGTAPGAAWRSGQGVGAPRPGELLPRRSGDGVEPGWRRKRGRGEPGGACPPAAHCGRVRGRPGPRNAARVRGGRRSAGEPRSYLPPRRPPGAGAPAAISYLPLRLPIGPPHHPSSAPPRPGRASPLAAAGTAPPLLAGSNGQLPIRAHGGGGRGGNGRPCRARHAGSCRPAGGPRGAGRGPQSPSGRGEAPQRGGAAPQRGRGTTAAGQPAPATPGVSCP